MRRVHRPRPPRPPKRGRDLLWLFFDRSIFTRWRNFLFQSGLATLSLIIVFLVEDAVLRAAIVVAVASTTFIVFVIPDSVAAQPQRVIGGHVVAVITGTLFWLLLSNFDLAYGGDQPRYFLDIAAALSVGLSLLLIVATNTEHPPAAGTALGLVIHGSSWDAVFFIISSAVILSLIRIALKGRLVNLL